MKCEAIAPPSPSQSQNCVHMTLGVIKMYKPLLHSPGICDVLDIWFLNAVLEYSQLLN